MNVHSDEKEPPVAEQGKAADLHHDACAVRVIDSDKVADARMRVMGTAETVRVTELFKLLGDPTRVRMLNALAKVGELCVRDLAAVVGAPETSVSHALRLLRTAGVVRSRPSGRMVYYSLDDDHVRTLLDVSAEHLRHGSPAPAPTPLSASERAGRDA